MQRVDHLNTDDPAFPVKCVRKFESTLGREVTYKCEWAYVYIMNKE